MSIQYEILKLISILKCDLSCSYMSYSFSLIGLEAAYDQHFSSFQKNSQLFQKNLAIYVFSGIEGKQQDTLATVF